MSAMVHKDVFNSKARALIFHEKSDEIKIDWLAFSLPITALRHCRNAGSVKLSNEVVTGYKKSFFDGEIIPITKKVKSLGIYPQPPSIKSCNAVGIEELEAYNAKVSLQMISFYEDTLKRRIKNL